MSSDALNNENTAPDADAQADRSDTFRPDRTHILSAVVLGLISLLSIGAAPQYLWWILAFPILFIWWVLKSATVVDENGIEAKYAFRGAKKISWDDFSGIGFKGARTFARTTDDQDINLPGVTFNSLPRLQQASYGRIPDALTEGRAAMDGKIVVVQEDGYSVVLTKEEYVERQRALGRDIQIELDEDDTPHDATGINPTDTVEETHRVKPPAADDNPNPTA